MKGKKQCPNCVRIVGARAARCECGHIFYAVKSDKNPKPLGKFKISKLKRKALWGKANWKELQAGDIIKVRGGPYYLSIQDKAEVKMPIGYKGEFKVIKVVGEGILGIGNKKEGPSATCFIHMEGKYVSAAGVHRRPHKLIKRINRNE